MKIQLRVSWLGVALGLVFTAHGWATDSGRLLGSSFGVPGLNATYDYVVVGGGTAGLTIASRLVEQNAGSVGVIEAGTFYELSNGNKSEIPAYCTSYVGKSPTDWQPLADWGYITTPQPGANNLSMHYPRGKMLGGCSARNYMIYHRASVGAYDMWADQVGDDDYTFSNFLPYLEKSLNFTPPNAGLRLQNATPEYDGSLLGDGQGPLSVSYPNWAYAFATWATRAFAQRGISVLKEGFSNGALLGQSYGTFTIDYDTMIRSSSETAFLRKSLQDPNYYLYPLTMARKIIFSNSNVATGVEVDTFGAKYTISAQKEVILSAGAIGSPQLLQASGVGPAELLQSLGIPIVADRPGVGQNMQDHVVFGISRGVNAITSSSLGDAAFADQQAQLFDQKAAGLLTTPGADLLAFEKLPNTTRGSFTNSTLSALATKFPSDWPEAEYIALSGYLGNLSVVADPGDGTAYATIAAVLVSPLSRGSVNITSPDTSVPPAIDPQYLTNPADVEVVVGAFKRARQFWASSEFDGFLVGDEKYPGPDVQTDAQIEAAIRESFQTIFHGSCTCAMGASEDDKAVVDPQARVYGVPGLRVVDASAFPFLPPGHPQSTVYALAEKIACDISYNC